MSDRCEPPPRWYWVQYDENSQWFPLHAYSPDMARFDIIKGCSVATPAELAALRAERDAAWNEVEREREKYKDDMHAAIVEVARWSQRSGLQDADLATLRAEVERLRHALVKADQFIRNGIEFGYIRMPNPSTPDPALLTPGIIKAALEPKP